MKRTAPEPGALAHGACRPRHVVLFDNGRVADHGPLGELLTDPASGAARRLAAHLAATPDPGGTR